MFGTVATITLPGLGSPHVLNIAPISGLWALQGALLSAILLVVVIRYRQLRSCFAEGSRLAVAGALLVTMNTASEYGFGAVISALPGFVAVGDSMGLIPNPLVNAAITTAVLAGITGLASAGLSIALAAMAGRFVAAAQAAGIPLEVLHRGTAMASGDMDSLPQSAAVITLLAVTGLTHRESYNDIFAITLLKTAAVFVVIGINDFTGLV